MTLCPKCGKPSIGLCLDCFLEDNEIKIDPVKLSICGCGRIRYKDRWDSTLDEIGRDLARRIKLPYELNARKIQVEPKIEDKNASIEVTIEGSFNGKAFKRKIIEKSKIQPTTCEACSRKSGGYFEAVLQVRCKVPELHIADRDIAKIDQVRGGVDYYLLSNNHARKIASELSRKGYKVVVSNKTFSMRDGHEIYRMFYSIKEDKPST